MSIKPRHPLRHARTCVVSNTNELCTRMRAKFCEILAATILLIRKFEVCHVTSFLEHAASRTNDFSLCESIYSLSNFYEWKYRDSNIRLSPTGSSPLSRRRKVSLIVTPSQTAKRKSPWGENWESAAFNEERSNKVNCLLLRQLGKASEIERVWARDATLFYMFIMTEIAFQFFYTFLIGFFMSRPKL